MFCELGPKPIQEDGQHGTNTEERNKMGRDGRTKHGLQEYRKNLQHNRV